MDLVIYGEIRGYLKALSEIEFNKYLKYDFFFENVNLVDNNLLDSLKQHILCCHYVTETEPPNISLTEIENWHKAVILGFHDFDISDKVEQKFLHLLEDFFGTNSIKVWEVSSDSDFGVLQFEFLFEVNNCLYYLLMYLND
jgi:hypothetical protein